MSQDQLETALRAFGRRRPFRPFLIEFNSGDRILVSHPECVRRHKELFYYVGPGRSQRLFTGAGVSQLIDAASSVDG
jgi:hypothetical protein